MHKKIDGECFYSCGVERGEEGSMNKRCSEAGSLRESGRETLAGGLSAPCSTFTSWLCFAKISLSAFPQVVTQPALLCADDIPFYICPKFILSFCLT